MSDTTVPLTVSQAIAKLHLLEARGLGNLYLQTTTPCGQKSLVGDLVTGPADFGLLVQVQVTPS